jgi:hypothetical protein
MPAALSCDQAYEVDYRLTREREERAMLAQNSFHEQITAAHLSQKKRCLSNKKKVSKLSLRLLVSCIDVTR